MESTNLFMDGIINQMPKVSTDYIERHQGQGIWDVFEEMMSDPHIQSVFRSRRAAVAGRRWDIVSADDTDKSKKIAEFVKQVLLAIPNFEHAIAHFMKSVPYGHSVCEIMWRIDHDAVRVDALRTRRPERFALGPDSTLKLLDRNSGEIKKLPTRKFVCHRHEPQDEKPYSIPLLFKVYWPWYFKKHARAMFETFAVRFGIPSVLGRYPSQFTDTDVRNLVDDLAKLATDSNPRSEDENPGDFFRELLDYMNDKITKIVLGHIPGPIDNHGSYAKARTHQEVRQEMIACDARNLQITLGNTLIRWLVDFNYGVRVPTPKLVIDYLPERGTPEFSQTLKTLQDLGYKVPTDFISKTFGLPNEDEK